MNATGTSSPRWLAIGQIACLVDGGCYLVETGIRNNEDEDRLVPGTASGVDGVITVAGVQALAAGWVQRVDGYWLCPAHAHTYLDRHRRQFSVTECAHRHRLRARLTPAPATSRVA